MEGWVQRNPGGVIKIKVMTINFCIKYNNWDSQSIIQMTLIFVLTAIQACSARDLTGPLVKPMVRPSLS